MRRSPIVRKLRCGEVPCPGSGYAPVAGDARMPKHSSRHVLRHKGVGWVGVGSEVEDIRTNSSQSDQTGKSFLLIRAVALSDRGHVAADLTRKIPKSMASAWRVAT